MADPRSSVTHYWHGSRVVQNPKWLYFKDFFGITVYITHIIHSFFPHLANLFLFVQADQCSLVKKRQTGPNLWSTVPPWLSLLIILMVTCNSAKLYSKSALVHMNYEFCCLLSHAVQGTFHLMECTSHFYSSKRVYHTSSQAFFFFFYINWKLTKTS